MKRPCVLALVLAAGCGGEDPAGDAPDLLSRWGLFAGDAARQRPAQGVVPYEVIAPLFSDHTRKHRFLRLPPGAAIEWSAEGRWSFPEGTVAVKTFSFPRDGGGERLVETRLLVREEGGWKPYVYLWDDAQRDATRLLPGKRVPVSFTDDAGTRHEIRYAVPDVNQCERCHAADGEVNLLGPRTRQLDRDNDYGEGPVNQLDHMAALGMFSAALPPREQRVRLVDPWGDAPLEDRARAYLEANCAHCHSRSGAAGASNLLLGVEITSPTELGFCKLPVSAGEGTGGRPYDIVPGQPDQSILVFRMESTVPDVRMPELPNVLIDHRGVQLVRDWIAGLAPQGCPGAP